MKVTSWDSSILRHTRPSLDFFGNSTGSFASPPMIRIGVLVAPHFISLETDEACSVD
jgi:hypothetical protein